MLQVSAVIGMAYAFVGYALTREPYNVYFYSGIACLIIGVVLFVLSKPLAALIVKGLRD